RWRRLGHFSPPGDLAFLQRRGFIRLAHNIGGGNHYCRRLARKRELQHTRVEEIFFKIQTAVTFALVLKPAVPIAAALERLRVVSKMQGRQSSVRRK